MEQFQQLKLKQEKQKTTQNKTPNPSHIFCSVCGSVLKQGDIFCPNCGTPRNTENIALAFATEEKKEPKKQPSVLSKEAAEQILKINNKIEIQNPLLQNVYKKFEQHSLMLNEKRIRKEAESRIDSHFNFIKDNQLSDAEFEYFSKITQALRTSAIKQDMDFSEVAVTLQEKDSEINKLVDQRKKQSESLIKLQQDAISSELAAIEAEKKRREIEELQRKIEIEQERKRREEEKILKGFAGSYSNAHNCPCGGFLHEKILINLDYSNGKLSGTKTYKWNPECGFEGGRYAGTIYVATIDVKLAGNIINLTETEFGFIRNPNHLTPSDFKHFFEGTVSADGTLIKGHWYDDNKNSDGYFDYFKFR